MREIVFIAPFREVMSSLTNYTSITTRTSFLTVKCTFILIHSSRKHINLHFSCNSTIVSKLSPNAYNYEQF